MAEKFDPNKFMKGKKRKPTVCYPDGMPNEKATLWGYYFEESNYYNIVGVNSVTSEMGGVAPVVIGKFYTEKPDELEAGQISGYYEDNAIKFVDGTGVECDLEPVQLKMDIFSRNTGILESDKNSYPLL